MTAAADPRPLVCATQVAKVFARRSGSWLWRGRQVVRVLDGVSLDVGRGETVGLVGESGCGKTTFGKSLLRLNGAIEGRVLYDGVPVHDLEPGALRALRRRMQMIFQNPYAALNNHLRVREIIAEGLAVRGVPRAEREGCVTGLLDQVNLSLRKADQFPWALSGGERRRVGIARILAVDPEFIVADEPVAALDLSIKSQIINLLSDLRERRGLTYLFISHDIGVVKYMSDRIAVMYLGKIVEVGDSRVFREERCIHPYTRQLLRAARYMSSSWETGFSLDRSQDGADWDVPAETPPGCRYHPRCPLYQRLGRPAACHSQEPPLEVHSTVAGRPHRAACHFSGEETGGTA